MKISLYLWERVISMCGKRHSKLMNKTNRHLTFEPTLRMYYSQLTACDFQQVLTLKLNPPDNTNLWIIDATTYEYAAFLRSIHYAKRPHIFFNIILLSRLHERTPEHNLNLNCKFASRSKLAFGKIQPAKSTTVRCIRETFPTLIKSSARGKFRPSFPTTIPLLVKESRSVLPRIGQWKNRHRKHKKSIVTKPFRQNDSGAIGFQ